MSMRNKLIVTIIFVIILGGLLSSPAVTDDDKTVISIDFSKDINRLSTLQNKFREAKSPVERYQYASIIVEYIKRMSLRAEKVRDLYYKPAMLIMTEELPSTIELKTWDNHFP